MNVEHSMHFAATPTKSIFTIRCLWLKKYFLIALRLRGIVGKVVKIHLIYVSEELHW